MHRDANSPLAAKFADPEFTASGQRRAEVSLHSLETLWINTGALCNIECRNCYIESSPHNDRLAYVTADEVVGFLDEIERERLGTTLIGFTGGEPFVNRHFMAMLEACLSRGFTTLVLTNAMRPMRNLADGLVRLRQQYGGKLATRVSVDHYTVRLHEAERGPGTWPPMVEGLRWLANKGFHPTVAGRTCWGEDEPSTRRGYAKLFEALNVDIDAHDPHQLLLFPEMDESADVPEITAECWNVVSVAPRELMCASSRMVVKRKGAARPAVVACTLIPYDRRFELGASLAEAASTVKLNHPHCSKFCVLGGGSCVR